MDFIIAATDLTHCFLQLYVCICLFGRHMNSSFTTRPLLTAWLLRIHWWIRRGWRPSKRQDRYPAQRPPQQDRCHFSTLQCTTRRSREVGRETIAKSTIRLYCPDNECWHHGPWGGKKEACCRKDHWVLLLENRVEGVAKSFAAHRIDA